MTNWDGVGLPPVATRRIERAEDSGVHTSLLSVPGQTGLDSCGFMAVGEVMGYAVRYLGFQGWAGCGWGGGPMTGYGSNLGSYGYGLNYGMVPLKTATRRSGQFFGLSPYLQALDDSWGLALGRMTEEARRLGADGIVGVKLTDTYIDEYNREFLAMGTAVRSLGHVHIDRPFSTMLEGQDVAKLLRSGYVPAGIIVAISIGIRHDDYRTLQTASAWGGNAEVPGYTDLVETTRDDTRAELTDRVAAHHATGAITHGQMQLHIHEVEVGEGHRDHVAIATQLATAISAFRAVPSHKTEPVVFLANTERRSE